MVKFLRGRGITRTRETMPAGSLKASQAEWSPEKVRCALNYEGPEDGALSLFGRGRGERRGLMDWELSNECEAAEV